MSVVVSLYLDRRQFDTRSDGPSKQPGGHWTREADELLIEAVLATWFSIQRCFAVYRFFHRGLVLQNRKSA
jgi:hypothetical protein